MIIISLILAVAMFILGAGISYVIWIVQTAKATKLALKNIFKDLNTDEEILSAVAKIKAYKEGE